MKAILDGLKSEGAFDLVADLDAAGMPRLVVMVDADYFSGPSMSELIDGEFRVLGKVTRVVAKDDSINLLRNTSLARFPGEIISKLRDAFQAAKETGLDFPNVETDIQGPALQVIPIAIFA